MFRESGFDRKTMPVAYTVVFFSHALDHSVSRIKRIKSHVSSFFHASVTCVRCTGGLLIFMLR